jgi:hypothetical protein
MAKKNKKKPIDKNYKKMSKILLLKENNNFNKIDNIFLISKRYQLNYKNILERSKFN